jgi:hypothetical protein
MGIAVALLGGIALHGILQKVTLHTILEQLRHIGAVADDLITQDRSRRGFVRAMGHYIEVQDLKFKLRDSENAAYGEVADRLLAPPFRILDSLADGEVNVPEYLIAATFTIMLEAYSKRFDAVSNDDLAFWHDNKSIARRYLSQNIAALRRGMIVTRLFIFPGAQLLDETDRKSIAEVISYQMSLGISWALAIYDDLEPGLPPGPLDFALFDGNRAVSTFRREGERRFIATFNTDGLIRRNDDRLLDQCRLYEALLGEVWLASSTFAKSFLGSDNDRLLAQLRQTLRCTRSV